MSHQPPVLGPVSLRGSRRTLERGLDDLFLQILKIGNVDVSFFFFSLRP